jgi:hypothetical protein
VTGGADAGGADPGGGRVLSAAQIVILAAIQDRLIPPEGDLPGAGAAGAARRVDVLVAERPEWRADLLSALDAVEGAARDALVARGAREALPGRQPPAGGFLDLDPAARDAALRRVEGEQPYLFRRLLLLTYSAYYTDFEVLFAAGYAAEPPLPRGYPLDPFDATRLDPVRRRGRRWRDA